MTEEEKNRMWINLIGEPAAQFGLTVNRVVNGYTITARGATSPSYVAFSIDQVAELMDELFMKAAMKEKKE